MNNKEAKQCGVTSSSQSQVSSSERGSTTASSVGSGRTGATNEGITITQLEAENVKRLRAVRIRPDGSIVTISGKNGAGKSTVLDSIAMAFGGGASIPKEPLRQGASKGEPGGVLIEDGEVACE